MINSNKFPIESYENVYKRIYSSALKLLYPYTPEKTYATIVNEAMKLVGAKYGSLFLDANGYMQRVYTSNQALEEILPRKRGNTWKAFTQQKPYMYEYTQISKLHPEIGKLHIGSDIGMPIAYDDKSFGVLSVLSPKGKVFTTTDLFILQMFSPLASLALRNTLLYSEVVQALKEQDMFISLAAHELKTPLTAISVYSQLALKDETLGKYKNINIKEKMFWEIQRLSKLVNELLQVSQIKKGRMQYNMKKCDIGEVVDQTVSSFQTSDVKHTIKLKNDIGTHSCYIKADKDKMTQVITNLLTNASKFSPKGTKIIVSLKKKPDNLIITVKDQGIGMSAEQLPRIFEGFYKGALKKKEGLGLGLFLVKNIIDAHRGAITVKSVFNKGTTFIITLPLYRYTTHEA